MTDSDYNNTLDNNLEVNKKYSNNHYEILLQNNSSKKIYHCDGTNSSYNDIYLKFKIDTKLQYEVLNSNGDVEFLTPGEYTLAVFWNTLEIIYNQNILSNELMGLEILVPWYNADDIGHYDVKDYTKLKLDDLKPDVYLARIDVSNDNEMNIYTELNKTSKLDVVDSYQSLINI